jgi:hypothetical protein
MSFPRGVAAISRTPRETSGPPLCGNPVRPPHYRDGTQPPDLGVLAIQKRELRGIRHISGGSGQTGHLVRILGGLHKTATPTQVLQALKPTGICSTWSPRHGVLLARVDRIAATSVPHWSLSNRRVPGLAENWCRKGHTTEQRRRREARGPRMRRR